MKLQCTDDSHLWPVETRTHCLTPTLDLIPGRRCVCGTHVIIDPDPSWVPPDALHVADIESIVARAWASVNPTLVTW